MWYLHHAFTVLVFVFWFFHAALFPSIPVPFFKKKLTGFGSQRKGKVRIQGYMYGVYVLTIGRQQGDTPT